MAATKKRVWLKALVIILASLLFAFILGRATLKWSGVTTTNSGIKYLRDLFGKYSNSGFLQGCYTEAYLRSMGLDSEDARVFPDRFVELVLNRKFEDAAVRSEIVLGAEKLGFKLDKGAEQLPNDAITLELEDETLFILMRNKADGRLKIGLTYSSSPQSRRLSQALFICLP